MERSPIVKVKEGCLKGKQCVDYYGKSYFSFKGIPYAKPPVGKLRFKPAQPLEPWLGVKDAITEGNACYSRHMMYFNIIGSEDCLYLNVYTPDLQTPLKPVMFWVHGGAFLYGSGNSDFFGPDFLIHENVVLVTINYRLGILGFLSLNDPSLKVPGNLGLKDQVMALKWVRSNIDKFGGDPNNITIFGESVGAASVHYMMISPLSKGLFHKAILQSGNAIGNRGRGQYSTPLIAKALDRFKATDAEILALLEDMPIDKILILQDRIREPYQVSEFRSFGVVVEPYVTEDTFLPEEPINIIKGNKYYDVPTMLGFNSREGYLVKAIYKQDQVELDFESEIPHSLNIVKGSNLSREIANRIQKFFYGTETPSSSNSEAFFLLQGDNMFIRPLYNTARLHASRSKFPVYLYRVSIDSQLNLFKQYFNISCLGACHADEQSYLFKTVSTPKILPGSIEENGIKVFTKYWTTFAKTGNPNPVEMHPLISVEWKPVENDLIHFVDIGENVTVGVNPEPTRMQFWQEIEDMCCVSYK